MLEYVYGLCTTGTVQYREFKLQILRLLVDLYSGLEIPNYFSMCQCLLYLNDHEVSKYECLSVRWLSVATKSVYPRI